MNHLYYTNPENLNTVYANKLYDELSYLLKKAELTNIQTFFKNIPSFLKDINMPTEYFDIYLEPFIYETTFDIYHDANLALKMCSKDSFTNIRDCIRSQESSNEEYVKSLEPKVSKAKKKILSFSRDLDSYNYKENTFRTDTFNAHQSQKAMDFYNYFSHFLSTKRKRLIAFLDPKDIIFNLEKYNEFIYHPKNLSSGIQFYNYLAMVSCYLQQHPSPATYPSFEDEYAAYLLEQFHYPIQYQKCVGSYATMKFASDKYPEAYFPLLLYTKLFDTHNLSLTDYIFSKYGNLISGSFYGTNNEAIDLRYHSFFEMQLYNSILIPLLTFLIKKGLYDMFNGNLENIKKLSYNYLTHILHTSALHTHRETMPFSFHAQLNTVWNRTQKLHYPGYNKIPLVQNNLKSTSSEYLFNHHMSKAFFTNDIPKFFHMYQPALMPFHSIIMLPQRIANYYVTWENLYSKMTVKGKETQENSAFNYNRI